MVKNLNAGLGEPPPLELTQKQYPERYSEPMVSFYLGRYAGESRVPSFISPILCILNPEKRNSPTAKKFSTFHTLRFSTRYCGISFRM